RCPGGGDVHVRDEGEDVEPDGENAGDQGGDQDLVGGGDLVFVGVGGEVLAPAFAEDVGAQSAVQQPCGVGAGRAVQRDVDGVGVPDRHAQDGEHLRQQPQRFGVLGVGEAGVRVGGEILDVFAQVLHVHRDPAPDVVVAL